eukprot:g3739.t1
MFIVLPVFMGYAALFSLQRPLRLKFDTASLSSHATASFKTRFQLGVSFLYIGNLIFRMGHNVFFGCLVPRQRVYCSAVAMCVSMTILASLTAGAAQHSRATSEVWKVFLAYFAGGVSIGSFEANMVATVTPFGSATKVWTIAGMPVGVMVVTIGGFLLLKVDGQDPAPVYLATIAGLGATVALLRSLPRAGAAVVRRVHAPLVSLQNGAGPGAGAGGGAGTNAGEGAGGGTEVAAAEEAQRPRGKHAPVDIHVFVRRLRQWRQWLPQTRWHLFAMSFNMFAVAVSIPLVGYLYPGVGPDKRVPWGLQPAKAAAPAAGSTTAPAACAGDCPGIAHDYFMAIFNLFFSLGDTSSRMLVYPGARWRAFTCSSGGGGAKCDRLLWTVPQLPPMIFPLLFSCVGFGMVMSRRAPLVPLAGFFIAFGNGGLYGQSVAFIEGAVRPCFELVALSTWLFIGDVGSVIGVNMINKLTAAG